MVDLDGKEVILDEDIENNKVYDFEDTMELDDILSEVQKYGG